MSRDWLAWHRQYDDGSPLAARLAIVQRAIVTALDDAPPGPVRVLSVCAGDGRDLIGALTGHPRRCDVQAHLVELDGNLAGRARASAASAGLQGVEIVVGDAGTSDAYAGSIPADLLLVCGVFGNISGSDIEGTVAYLPALCAPGATVIWTRHRRPPDRTPVIRRWLRESGFDEVAFDEVPASPATVGVHRFVGRPAPFRAGVRLFAFADQDELSRADASDGP